MNKDWSGNSHTTFVTIGASNHVEEERQQNDYYATDPIAMKLLLKQGGGYSLRMFGNVL